MGLHYYHIMLDFCEMNSVLRVFSGFCFSESFFGFSVGGKVFIWVVQKYGNLGKNEKPIVNCRNKCPSFSIILQLVCLVLQCFVFF